MRERDIRWLRAQSLTEGVVALSPSQANRALPILETAGLVADLLDHAPAGGTLPEPLATALGDLRRAVHHARVSEDTDRNDTTGRP